MTRLKDCVHLLLYESCDVELVRLPIIQYHDDLCTLKIGILKLQKKNWDPEN